MFAIISLDGFNSKTKYLNILSSVVETPIVRVMLAAFLSNSFMVMSGRYNLNHFMNTTSFRSNGGPAHCGPRGLNHSYPGPRAHHNHTHSHNHLHSHSLNVSTLSTSKHSLGGGSSVGHTTPKIANGGLHISTNTYDAFSNNRYRVFE